MGCNNSSAAGPSTAPKKKGKWKVDTLPEDFAKDLADGTLQGSWTQGKVRIGADGPGEYGEDWMVNGEHWEDASSGAAGWAGSQIDFNGHSGDNNRLQATVAVKGKELFVCDGDWKHTGDYNFEITWDANHKGFNAACGNFTKIKADVNTMVVTWTGDVEGQEEVITLWKEPFWDDEEDDDVTVKINGVEYHANVEMAPTGSFGSDGGGDD